MRCLIVDDSQDFLASATLLLQSQGLEVVGCASSHAQALQLAAQLAPDVVLVDIELADEDGIVLAQELGLRAPAACVVLISAHEQVDVDELVSDSGAAGFLSKSALGAPAIAALAS